MAYSNLQPRRKRRIKCRYFNSESGCLRGDSCWFHHGDETQFSSSEASAIYKKLNEMEVKIETLSRAVTVENDDDNMSSHSCDIILSQSERPKRRTRRARKVRKESRTVQKQRDDGDVIHALQKARLEAELELKKRKKVSLIVGAEKKKEFKNCEQQRIVQSFEECKDASLCTANSELTRQLSFVQQELKQAQDTLVAQKQEYEKKLQNAEQLQKESKVEFERVNEKLRRKETQETNLKQLRTKLESRNTEQRQTIEKLRTKLATTDQERAQYVKEMTEKHKSRVEELEELVESERRTRAKIECELDRMSKVLEKNTDERLSTCANKLKNALAANIALKSQIRELQQEKELMLDDFGEFCRDNWCSSNPLPAPAKYMPTLLARRKERSGTTDNANQTELLPVAGKQNKQKNRNNKTATKTKNEKLSNR